jgi:hypothetical protein
LLCSLVLWISLFGIIFLWLSSIMYSLLFFSCGQFLG